MALWSLLKSDQRPLLENSCQPKLLRTITLPEGLVWPFGREVGRTLFIRPSQKRVEKEVLAQYSTARKRTWQPGTGYEPHGCIIKGTSGIGKLTLLS